MIRERFWLIAAVAIVSAGLATGFALVAAPQHGASILALVTGPALLAGLILGVGAAFLSEYVARGPGRRWRPQRRPDPSSAVQEPSDKESPES